MGKSEEGFQARAVRSLFTLDNFLVFAVVRHIDNEVRHLWSGLKTKSDIDKNNDADSCYVSRRSHQPSSPTIKQESYH